jgi:hypothetical protein
VQRRPAFRRRLAVDLRAHRDVGAGQRVQPLRERAVVQHGAANQQRDSSFRKNLRDRVQGIMPEATR